MKEFGITRVEEVAAMDAIRLNAMSVTAGDAITCTGTMSLTLAAAGDPPSISVHPCRCRKATAVAFAQVQVSKAARSKRVAR
jgi:hypothetical protein